MIKTLMCVLTEMLQIEIKKKYKKLQQVNSASQHQQTHDIL